MDSKKQFSGASVQFLFKHRIPIYDQKVGEFYLDSLPVGYERIVVQWNRKHFAWIIKGWPEQQKSSRPIYRGRETIQNILGNGALVFDSMNGKFYREKMPLRFDFVVIEMVTATIGNIVSGWPCRPFSELLEYEDLVSSTEVENIDGIKILQKNYYLQELTNRSNLQSLSNNLPVLFPVV